MDHTCQHVAFSADRHEHLWGTSIVSKLCPEIGDVHVNGSRLHVARVQSPHMAEQFIARHRMSGFRCKVTKQFHLPLGQFFLPAIVTPHFELGKPTREAHLALFEKVERGEQLTPDESAEYRVLYQLILSGTPATMAELSEREFFNSFQALR